ncbi:hypothetical protein M441DRAFT_299560 [Trichoderma asperellum CBS 433.97]|uniref:Uncharacterized protein n=1 Tax=Trichoderma asperellum (strain ATCC 204424 / CBS 433.97 / NBRC 101777) TaxID=1042311 RepID=A0A2T3ZJ54_TRIA4|nr:hypothetical protein M441DRAFT_299560 [Trichoderma asperellum CBS 433.97]PTB44826.1 hypothetical protein M441DRAFT_299560 [Trichoderma asperellum CBS 433.97]
MNYQRHQCNEWMKLGLEGVNVALPLLDGGVGGLADGCPGGPFNPISPTGCPFIIAIGIANVTAYSIDGKKTVEQGVRFSGGGILIIKALLL